ncbi:MAG TPA: M28 family peptidase [Planctomycetota bacterium]|nr:M28 family peptidase [Planctomycetota bacterium]
MDALEHHVRALAYLDGRRVGMPGHERARRYLLEEMKAIGVAPFYNGRLEHSYAAGGLTFTNIVGRIPGSRPGGGRPILLGAHYDSVIDAPCADDNLAAVAVVMEVARAVRESPLEADLLAAFFDAEEPPHFLGPNMGSIRFYEEHLQAVGVACAVILDLVGHDVESRFPLAADLEQRIAKLLFITGSESHAALPGVVETAAARTPGLGIVPTIHDYVGDMSDHHIFRKHGQSFLFLSCGQGRNYHSAEDTPEWLNFEKLAHVSSFVRELVRGMDTPSQARAGRVDTTQFEIRMLERALGARREVLADLLGLPQIETREDLTSVVQVLSSVLQVWAR